MPRAYVIGIGGGSGSGKSELAQRLRARLHPLRVRVINQDAYFLPASALPTHRARRSGRVWPDHNHPDSFDFARLRTDLRAARQGDADVVIVEGILALHDPALRALMDLRVFVDCEADERVLRRLLRNVAAGCDFAEACEFYLDSVRYRHREFCEPTRAHADLILPAGRDEPERTEQVLEEVRRRALRAAPVETARQRAAEP